MNKQLREIPLNPTELNTLQSIAALCPYYDGIAVYDARSILMDNGFAYVENDCETTPFIAPTPKGQKRLKALSETPVIAIYPNPFKEEVRIDYVISEGTNGQIELVDIMGRTVLQKQIGNTHLINTKELKHGLYFYTFSVNNMIVQQGKILKE